MASEDHPIGYKLVAHRPPNEYDFPGPNSLGSHFYRLQESSANQLQGRYLCVCKLDDIWQLHRTSYEERESARTNPYLLDLVSREIGDDLRTGRCFLLLDQSREGHPFVRRAFDDLHDWCAKVGLARLNVGFATQNRAIKRDYDKHYAKDGDAIHFLYYDWFINAFAGILKADENVFLAKFGFSKSAELGIEADAYQHPFLCQNATPRVIRVCTLAALSAAGLLPRTLWSLLTESAGKGSGRENDIHAFLTKVGRDVDLYPYALALLKGPDKRLDNILIKKDANQLTWSIDYQSFKNTCVSLVTETEFTEGQIVRVTEKSIKAAAMGRPFLIFGNPGSLGLMHQFGFQTFDPFIDETYDRSSDVSVRFQALTDELLRINQLLLTDGESFVGASKEVAMFNAAHARNGGLYRDYKRNVEGPFWDALRTELLRECPPTCS